MSKNVVWENKDNGTRFRTLYDPNEKYETTDSHILIGENLSDDDALALCKLTETKNINSFLDDMPDELRNPYME